MSEVSHYGTRPLQLSPEAIFHYIILDWQKDVMSAPWQRDFLLLIKAGSNVIYSV